MSDDFGPSLEEISIQESSRLKADDIIFWGKVLGNVIVGGTIGYVSSDGIGPDITTQIGSILTFNLIAMGASNYQETKGLMRQLGEFALYSSFGYTATQSFSSLFQYFS